MDAVFVDFQGFIVHKNEHAIDVADDHKNVDEFIVKEICLHTENKYFHYIVKSPYDYAILSKTTRKQIRWLHFNYHGLLWESGDVYWSQVRDSLAENFEAKTVYVKGQNKIQWAKKIFNDSNLNVVNMEDIGCPITLHKEHSLHPCEYHTQRNKSHCAFQNVIVLKRWYFLNKCQH